MIRTSSPPLTTTGGRPVWPQGILAQELRHLSKHLEGIKLPAEATGALEKCVQLAEGLDPYLDSVSSTPSPALVAVEKAARTTDWDGLYERGETDLRLESEMVSGALAGQFLRLLVRSLPVKTVLEIGTFAGYGAVAMLEGLTEDGFLDGLEYDTYVAGLARRHLMEAGFEEQSAIHEGDGQESLRKLAKEGKSYDLVFIDADKQGYAGYYETLFDLELISSGSLVLIDNTLYQGEAYGCGKVSANGHAIAAFNQLVKEDPRTEQVLIPLRDGITFVRVI